MDECGITNKLIGMRLFASGVDKTAFAHSPCNAFNDARERHLTDECKAQRTRSPLADLLSFARTASRVLPTAHNGHPVLDEQAKYFGIDFGLDACRLATAPRIDFAILFPQFPQQFDLPSTAHDHQGFLCTEQIGWDVGQ